jgi:hypothetical protein
MNRSRPQYVVRRAARVREFRELQCGLDLAAHLAFLHRSVTHQLTPAPGKNVKRILRLSVPMLSPG